MATRIKDGMIPYTGWQGIEITNNHVINVLLRELNNLIHVNEDRELYVDLQLDDWIEPDDDFPVGVTTWKILQEDWWTQSGIILNWKTTSGDYVRFIYANDWKLYYDPGTWVWIEIWWSGWGGVQINVATASTLWIIKLGSDTQQAEAQVTATSVNGRTYPVQLNSSNQAVVNIPWTDTTYTAGSNITINQNNEISATIPQALVYKWNVNGLADLPASGTVWDTYFVVGEDAMYSWDWTQWNYVGGTGIDLTDLFNKTIDDSDDIVQWSTHLFVNSTEKNYWNNKQDPISAGTGIDVTSNVVSNTLPFDPQNTGSLGQFLKKTNDGYAWADVPSSGGWGGWGWSSYTAGNWINISNHVITNTKPFEPIGNWQMGQVLKRTADGYTWANETSSDVNIKCFELDLNDYSQSELRDIIGWINQWTDFWAVIKLPDTSDVVVYSRTTSSGWATIYEFQWILYNTDWNNDGNWDYTTLYNHMLKITSNNWTLSAEFVNFNWIANFLKVSDSGYNTPYMATQGYQPATKAYVDAVAAGSVSVWAITNNTTGTNLTLQQEWVGTQAQYDLITPINWVIYNIIPSS